jgi:hypothetical protein
MRASSSWFLGLALGAMALLCACDDQGGDSLPRSYGGGAFGKAPASSSGGGAGGGADTSGSNGAGSSGSGGADTGSQSSSSSSSPQSNAALAAVGGCMQQSMFDAIGFDQLTTTPDDNDPSDPAFCSSCHDQGQNGFVMAFGTQNDDTFSRTRTMPFVQAYVSVSNGAPQPSNAIWNESIASQTLGSKHPRFELTPDMTEAIRAFAADAVTRFSNKQCGN